MKKLFIILTISTVAVLNLSAQDILFKKDNTVIECIIQKITPDMIEYKRFDNQSGPVMSDYKKSFVKVRYSNGTTEQFTDNGATAVPAQPVVAATPVVTPAAVAAPVPVPIATTSDDAAVNCAKGTLDSKIFYKGENCGSVGTGVAAALLTPIGGLVVQSMKSGKAIETQDLNYPDVKQWANNDYKQCYMTTANATKKKKLGNALLGGSIAWILWVLLIRQA